MRPNLEYSFFFERQVSVAAWLGARLLLTYLRLKTKDIVKNCYPTVCELMPQFLYYFLAFHVIELQNFPTLFCAVQRTERADNWLISEMLRAVSSSVSFFLPSNITLTDHEKSKDPGGLVVLESIFSFDLSVPLNYLLEGLEERVLIIQGMKDPIYNSKAVLAKLKEQCVGVTIKELDAGHCPHDELPKQVNSILCEWILRLETKQKVDSQ
ncbi:hypothetical protein SDJN02_01252, partial [Cucurbita argyrosperma subsp. argyrosperma]